METNGKQSKNLKFLPGNFQDISIVVEQIPLGTCVPLISRTEESVFPEVIWYIKEIDNFIDAIPIHHPVINIQSASFAHGDVVLLVVLTKIEMGRQGDITPQPETFTVYETYMNYHAYRPNETNAIDLLIEQDRLVFAFYNNQCEKKRTIVTPNRIKDYFKETKNIILTRPPWTMQQFDNAKLYLQHQLDLETMWDVIEKKVNAK